MRIFAYMGKEEKKVLTEKQEKFCQLLVSGRTASDAYRGSYSASKQANTTIANNAYKLSNQPHVAARIKELKEELRAANMYTLEKSVERDLRLISIYESAIDVLQNVYADPMEVEAAERTIKHIGASAYNSAQERLSKQHGFFEVDNKQKQTEVVIFEMPSNGR